MASPTIFDLNVATVDKRGLTKCIEKPRHSCSVSLRRRRFEETTSDRGKLARDE